MSARARTLTLASAALIGLLIGSVAMIKQATASYSASAGGELQGTLSEQQRKLAIVNDEIKTLERAKGEIAGSIAKLKEVSKDARLVQSGEPEYNPLLTPEQQAYVRRQMPAQAAAPAQAEPTPAPSVAAPPAPAAKPAPAPAPSAPANAPKRSAKDLFG